MGADPRSPRADRKQAAARLGEEGERLAAAYLTRLGYRIVGRRFLATRGEIDLVCEFAGKLVMVEVKTRSSPAFGLPIEAVGAPKQRALVAAAAEYRALAGWRGPIEFAVVTVLLGQAAGPGIELLLEPF